MSLGVQNPKRRKTLLRRRRSSSWITACDSEILRFNCFISSCKSCFLLYLPYSSSSLMELVKGLEDNFVFKTSIFFISFKKSSSSIFMFLTGSSTGIPSGNLRLTSLKDFPTVSF
ncbi:hypothetical protein AWRI1631_101540 [Saccharomyces cerevisiae AWRI1631]|uniref:Uncharacterized protein n=1 Tax=Saccharomyces cerevisiae (strain AWRI1631) TaxID=545124 RepID=B5VLC8_YEAS6|nr:hypothetical protein AWRI1631_101540 [Saccharomyces cerevisiae AWRI1631]